jgi:hypothetical protein
MMEAVTGFNGQLERIAELIVVMVTGAMLSYTYVPSRAIWFLLLLFLSRARYRSGWTRGGDHRAARRAHPDLLVRLPGRRLDLFLMYAINRGLPEPLAKELIAITLTTVAASVVLHGISVTH